MDSINTSTNNKGKKFTKFIIFWIGSLIAAIGSGMTAFGIGVYVFEISKSATKKSMISLVAFLPTLLMSPLSGVLADKFDRRKMMILGDSLSLIGVFTAYYGIKHNFHPYIMILIGVFISAVFSSLIEPASKATITDLVDEKDYTKATGLMQLAGSARFLVSPILSTLIMTSRGITTILIIDMLTIFTTVAVVYYVRSSLDNKSITNEESIFKGFSTGLQAIKEKPGILVLVYFSILLTFMVGVIQELSVPMVLSFADKNSLSLALTISATGMIVSSLYLGAREIQKDKLMILSLSFFIAGLAMVGFASVENIKVVTSFGFIFFMTLPFINSLLDYFIRTNIANEVQARVWGLIGSLSQIGYLLAYGLSGLLADKIFIPLLKEGGSLANSIGRIIGIGPGRGVALFIIIAGICLSITSIVIYKNKDIRSLKS